MSKLMKKILSYVLIVSIILSTNISVFATENSQILSGTYNTISNVSLRSSGLAWGPVKVGNLEFKITNPHNGHVGGIGYVNHINFHIRNTNKKGDIANYHIVRYTTGNSECLYVYESVTKQTIINNCYSNWKVAVKDFVAAAKSVVKSSLSEADWVATATIWGVIIVVIADLLIPMDPVPIVPLAPPNQPVEF